MVEKEEEEDNTMGDRKLRFSSRENSDFKWKEEKTVVGALEVKSEQVLDFTAKLEEKKVLALEAEFEECLRIWKEQKLRKSFIEACEGIPPATLCCGLLNDQDATIRNMVPMLNKGWANSVNEKIADQGYKISCFVWSWNNPSGKAQTVVLLVRFHSLSVSRR